MSQKPTELEVLLDRARGGDDDACRQVVDTYGPTILEQIRRCLWQPLRRRVDSWDVLQEVLADFFLKRIHQERFATGEELVRYLAGMAQHAVQALHRFHCASAKRSVHREVRLDGTAVPGDALPDPRLDFDKELAGLEWCARALHGMPPEHAEMAQMLVHGFTLSEIARELRLCQGLATRMRDRIRKRFPTLCPDEACPV